MKNIFTSKRNKFIAASVLGLGMLGMTGIQPAEAASTAKNAADTTLSTPNKAQVDLNKNQQQIIRKASQEGSKEAVKADQVLVTVSAVEVTGNRKMSKEEVLYLVPELTKKQLNIRRLSRQIQMVNDSGALKLSADFKSAGQGQFKALLTVDEKKANHVNVGVSNTGNQYTGEWRYSTSYIASNLTNQSDTLGVAYVTAPGHLESVKQAALSYRMLLPKDAGSLVFTTSYSNVDLGSVYSYANLFDLAASGKSITAGMHYQHNFAYTSREKDILDIGIDHKRNSNAYDYQILGTTTAYNYDYNVTTLSVGFIHNNRTVQQSFTYDVGFTTNFDGSRADYGNATAGSDSHFNIWKAGAAYQYRTASDWIAGVRVHGQYTTNNLVATEQLGAGGISSVRGFNERVISADCGYNGSLEIYTPQFAKNSRVVFFADAAFIRSNNNQSLLHKDGIASAGIGYRYTDTKQGISLSIDYARVLNDINNESLNKQGHKRWNVMLNMSF